MKPKLKWHQNSNVTKTEMSPKLKCLKKLNVTKTEMLPKLKFYQILKSHQNLNLGDWPKLPWYFFVVS